MDTMIFRNKLLIELHFISNLHYSLIPNQLLNLPLKLLYFLDIFMVKLVWYKEKQQQLSFIGRNPRRNICPSVIAINKASTATPTSAPSTDTQSPMLNSPEVDPPTNHSAEQSTDWNHQPWK